eukprot:gene9534-6691_t
MLASWDGGDVFGTASDEEGAYGNDDDDDDDAYYSAHYSSGDGWYRLLDAGGRSCVQKKRKRKGGRNPLVRRDDKKKTAGSWWSWWGGASLWSSSAFFSSAPAPAGSRRRSAAASLCPESLMESDLDDEGLDAHKRSGGRGGGRWHLRAAAGSAPYDSQWQQIRTRLAGLRTAWAVPRALMRRLWRLRALPSSRGIPAWRAGVGPAAMAMAMAADTQQQQGDTAEHLFYYYPPVPLDPGVEANDEEVEVDEGVMDVEGDEGEYGGSLVGDGRRMGRGEGPPRLESDVCVVEKSNPFSSHLQDAAVWPFCTSPPLQRSAAMEEEEEEELDGDLFHGPPPPPASPVSLPSEIEGGGGGAGGGGPLPALIPACAGGGGGGPRCRNAALATSAGAGGGFDHLHPPVDGGSHPHCTSCPPLPVPREAGRRAAAPVIPACPSPSASPTPHLAAAAAASASTYTHTYTHLLCSDNSVLVCRGQLPMAQTAVPAASGCSGLCDATNLSLPYGMFSLSTPSGGGEGVTVPLCFFRFSLSCARNEKEKEKEKLYSGTYEIQDDSWTRKKTTTTTTGGANKQQTRNPTTTRNAEVEDGDEEMHISFSSRPITALLLPRPLLLLPRTSRDLFLLFSFRFMTSAALVSVLLCIPQYRHFILSSLVQRLLLCVCACLSVKMTLWFGCYRCDDDDVMCWLCCSSTYFALHPRSFSLARSFGYRVTSTQLSSFDRTLPCHPSSLILIR